jgi:transcriptional regulator with XRE-family HTH domain
MKQQFFARKCGMSYMKFNAGLNGRRSYSIAEAFQICDAMGMTMDDVRKQIAKQSIA